MLAVLAPLLASLTARAQDPNEGSGQGEPAAEPAAPEPPSDEAPPPIVVDPADIHEALRGLRTEVLEAVKSRNVDALLKTVHPDFVFTTTTGEAIRGRDGLRQYIDKMLEGPEASIKDFSYDVLSDELSVLHGDDTAVAWGPSTDHYTFVDGSTIDFPSRWSATLVRSEGRWLVASVHSSVPLFDNVVLDQAKAALPKVGIGALIGGIVLGGVIGLIAGRMSKR